MKSVNATSKPLLVARNLNVDQPVQAPSRGKTRFLRALDKEAPQNVKEQEAPLPPGCLPLDPAPLPPEVLDIDEDDTEHLEFSTEYVKNIYEYLFRLESQHKVTPK